MTTPPPPRQTLLVVDDEPWNVRVLVELLKDDFRLRTAATAEKALAIALSDDPPDLILLDIVLPDLDGYEVCRRLKAERRTQGIPVIFITGKASEPDQIRGFETGAVDYVTKPFSPVVVRARVNTHAELKRFRDQLELRSYSDGLTGLPNRRYYEESLERLWSFARREEVPLSFLMMNIDEFKRYNDCYGHLAGDECLRNVAQAIADIIRRKTDIVARYGGEEFCCILHDADEAGARRIAEAIRESVLRLAIAHEHSRAGPLVSVSIGGATAQPAKGLTPAALAQAADEALYAAKAAGRNCVSTTLLVAN